MKRVTKWMVAAGAAALSSGVHEAVAQTALPQITVNQPKPVEKPLVRKRRAARLRFVPTRTASRPAGRTVSRGKSPVVGGGAGGRRSGGGGGETGAEAASARAAGFDAARARILPRTGIDSTDIGRQAIEDMPQGDQAPIEKVILQAPGVAQDSEASGDYHVRNEHANVQYRIDGILLPDGVSGFGQILATDFIGDLALLTGALPAQYGLHTAGILDIQSRSGAFDSGGTVSLYGGSHGEITPSVDYGGHIDGWDYFFAGQFLYDQEGLENPAPSAGAIHDDTNQGRFFGYASKQIDNDTRVSVITGSSVGTYQIPDNPGQPVQFDAFGQDAFDSSLLNENQIERNVFGVAAVQKSDGNVDAQLAYFSRFSSLAFAPDPIGDVLFNGVASDVYRSSVANGVQGDMSYTYDAAHTLRFGAVAEVERATADNSSVVLPLDASGNPVDAPFAVVDNDARTGYTLGAYAQDEWTFAPQWTLNTGLRFDQIFQYVDANQLSPRVNLQYRPTASTALHAGFARYFTPPELVLAGPTNLAAVANTTQQPGVPLDSPVEPERSNVFDAGVMQKLLPGLEVGADAYYKRARDLLDDGQFGQALVLTAFNYAKAYNEGVEFTTNYQIGNFRAYGNLAIAQQKATQVVSNQFLFDAAEFDYIEDNWIYTDHTQIVTASGGLSYLWNGTRYSADFIYGGGLRNGFANTGHVPGYLPINLGLSHEFMMPNAKPLTVRFDIVNVFDEVYEIRDGSGIGVFAPQYGPRRGFFVGLSQKF